MIDTLNDGLTLESKGSGDLLLLKVSCWLLTVTVFASPRKTIDISRRLFHFLASVDRHL